MVDPLSLWMEAWWKFLLLKKGGRIWIAPTTPTVRGSPRHHLPPRPNEPIFANYVLASIYQNGHYMTIIHAVIPTDSGGGEQQPKRQRDPRDTPQRSRPSLNPERPHLRPCTHHLHSTNSMNSTISPHPRVHTPTNHPHSTISLNSTISPHPRVQTPPTTPHSTNSNHSN